jgi:D-alanyl-D-alanine carboxypeptidase (penicillin-binding protein 5/6)
MQGASKAADMGGVTKKRTVPVSMGLILFFALCFAPYIYAQQQSYPFGASSVSALLMDAHSGHILYSQNTHLRIQPASLAKMLTLFIIFDALKQGNIQLDTEVMISKKAAQTKGSKMYLREGTRIPVVELIKGIAVVSGNDACVAVAERLFESEPAFVEQMNQKIKRLRMQNSKFQTVDGWPVPDQYTTAHDMALLAQAYIREHPQALQYHRLKEFSHEIHLLHNRNGLLLLDPSVDGLKTGHVEAAGYHLLATAKRENQRLIAIVMGAESIEIREKEAMQLLNFGFSNFSTVKLFHKGQVLSHMPVLKGVKDRVGLVPQIDAVVTIPLSHKENVAFKITSPRHQEAPIRRDQKLGSAIISDQKKILKTVALFANEEIQRAGFLKIAWQTIEFFIAQHTVRLLVIISLILICILGLQTWYTLRLRRQLKYQYQDDDIVKERLDKILKPTDTD